MTLEQYMKEDDSNKFWRLSSGEHENLLDEAIEKMERYEKALKEIIHISDYTSAGANCSAIACKALS